MYAGHSIAVVVPAYNEEGFVGDVIRTMPNFVDRVYVIDDASTDGTWMEIQRTADQVSERSKRLADGGTPGTHVVPIRHEQNRGVGAAIKTGYGRAAEDDMDIAAVMGGDGQMEPDDLHMFLDPIVDGRAADTKGNRLMKWDHLAGMSPFRLFGNVVLTFLTKIASGYWRIADPQNGYTAVRLDVFEDVRLDSLYDEYGFANDLLVKLNAHGKRVADVPRKANYGDEESSIKYGSFIRSVSMLLLTNFLWRINVSYLVRDFHPLVLCYYGGAAAGGLAILATIAGILLSGVAGVGALLAAVVFACFSVTGLLTAMILEREHNAPLEIQAYD